MLSQTQKSLIYFLSFRVFEQLALVLKIFTVLKYFLSLRIFEQLAFALKNMSCPEIFHCIEIFLSFRIFEQLALALKTVCTEITVLNIYFYHSGFFSNLRLPWKQSLPSKFSRQGGRPPLRRPTSYVYACKRLFYSNSNHIFCETNKHNPFSAHRAYLCRFEAVIFQAIQNIVL